MDSRSFATRRRPPVAALRSCRPPPAAFRRSPFRLLVCSSRPRLGCAAVSLPSADTHSGPPKTWSSIRMSPSWTLDNDEKMRSPCVLGGVIFSISEAEVRTDTHNTHADAHTHGTCTSKQRAADHSHPAAHNTENRFSIKHFLVRLSHAAACTPTPDLASPQTHHAARSYRCGPMACVFVLKGPAIDLPTRHTEDCIGAVGQGRKN